MKRFYLMISVLLLAVALAIPSTYAAEDIAKKLNDVLVKAPAEKFWQVKADDVAEWTKEKKKDFLVIDVRPNPAEYKQGHIPGALQIPVQDILKPESLKKLPKDKKLILVCVTGQTQNLPILALRALGYDAYTMAFGMSAWQKGYHGAKLMQEAIKGAESKNYPLEK